MSNKFDGLAIQVNEDENGYAGFTLASEASILDMTLAELEAYSYDEIPLIPERSPAQIAESKNNRTIYPIALKGFDKAFAEVTRRYNPKNDRTTLSLRTIGIDGNKRVRTGKMTLSLWSKGDSCWRFHGDSESTGIIAAWYLPARGLSPDMARLMESTIRKVNNPDYPLWGKNYLADYVKSLRGIASEPTPIFNA